MKKEEKLTEMLEWFEGHPLMQKIKAERAAETLEKRLKGELLP